MGAFDFLFKHRKEKKLVPGHTSGHNYCKATGVNEGDLNIDMVKMTAPLLAPYADVTIYPIERDMYKDNAADYPALTTDDLEAIRESLNLS